MKKVDGKWNVSRRRRYKKHFSYDDGDNAKGKVLCVSAHSIGMKSEELNLNGSSANDFHF